MGADKKKRPVLEILPDESNRHILKDDMSSIPIRTCLINSDLKSTTKAILGALLSYCHNKDTCYPSVRDISQVWGYAESTIRKHIRILEKLEFIETTKGNKSRKSNNYKILKLDSVQNHPNGTRRERNKPEGLLEEHTYGATGGRFDKKNPPKALSVCDLDQSDRNRSPKRKAIDPKVVAQREEAIDPKVVAQREEAIDPKVVAQREEAIDPKVVAQREEAIDPKVVAQSQNKASFRFEGPLTTQKIVEIYNVYTRQGWIRRSYDSFLAFVSNCSLVKRLRKRNPYGYLTWIYKKKFDRKLITAKDEKLAMDELKLIQNMGIMPDFTEAQRYQTTPPEAPVPPPAPPTRSTSRPAMDWPERNLPGTGKEAALAKKVEHRQLSHVHPSWMIRMGCWIVKVRKVDGKRFYEQQDLTPDGWFEVASMTEIVPLINSESKRISQACFIEILASGGFFASDPTLPAT